MGWLKSVPASMPTVVVGNLSVGGTGKTPMVEYLIRKFYKELKVATLSRGYGRKTKGFLQASKQVIPEEIGDEPFQIYQKFGNEISVCVGEDRINALEIIGSKTDSPELVILDDAYQHRYVKGDLTVLLTTYQQPFFSDYLLPMGRLRESRAGAKRADVVLITKCPDDISDLEKSRFEENASFWKRPDSPVLFSFISYGNPTPLFVYHRFSSKIILLTGLANDRTLVEFVEQKYELLDVIRYEDHHDYTSGDFSKIRGVYKQLAAQNPVVLTTEKDAVKVKSNAPKGFLEEIPIFVLPIELSFSADDELTLVQLIQQKVFKKGKS